MSDLPTAQRADSRCAAGRPNHDWSIQEKNKENPERKVVPDLFRRRGFPTEKTYQNGAGFSLKEGGLLLLSAAKEKKEKKAIRHRGVGAPNKGMSRNGAETPWGLLAPEKRCFEAAPCRGLARRLRCGRRGCRPWVFSPTSVPEGFQRGTKGRRKAGCPWATRSAFGRLNFSN